MSNATWGDIQTSWGSNSFTWSGYNIITFLENLSLLDSLLKDINKSFEDDVLIREELVKIGANASWGDSFALWDDINYTWAGYAFRSLSDILSLSENYQKQVAKTISETLFLSESKSLSVVKKLFESVSLSETFIKQLYLYFFEIITSQESFAKKPTKAFIENVLLNEQTIKKISKTLSETLSFSESFYREIKKVVDEVVFLNEEQIRDVAKIFSESILMNEMIAKEIYRKFLDSISLTENVLKKVGKIFSDNIYLTEYLFIPSFLRLKSKVLKDKPKTTLIDQQTILSSFIEGGLWGDSNVYWADQVYSWLGYKSYVLSFKIKNKSNLLKDKVRLNYLGQDKIKVYFLKDKLKIEKRN
ncbi:MAG: hypothetical protein QXX45_03305 [Candidatus Aenigmatarchaeota archaeon]